MVRWWEKFLTLRGKRRLIFMADKSLPTSSGLTWFGDNFESDLAVMRIQIFWRQPTVMGMRFAYFLVKGETK